MKLVKVTLFLFNLLLLVSCQSISSINAQEQQSYVGTNSGFAVVNNKIATSIYFSDNEHIGVLKIAKKFQEDIERVTNIKPTILTGATPSENTVIIVGTIGNSELIDKLIADKKLDVSSIEGKWETFLIETIKNPFDGVKEALVIVGSDKRGSIFGMFDMSSEMGVSPLYFWADVPVKKKIYLLLEEVIPKELQR